MLECMTALDVISQHFGSFVDSFVRSGHGRHSRADSSEATAVMAGVSAALWENWSFVAGATGSGTRSFCTFRITSRRIFPSTSVKAKKVKKIKTEEQQH